jgi:hypothetical protein
MQDLLAIALVLVCFLGGLFALWTVFCLILRGMFRIADRVFGL